MLVFKSKYSASFVNTEVRGILHGKHFSLHYLLKNVSFVKMKILQNRLG